MLVEKIIKNSEFSVHKKINDALTLEDVVTPKVYRLSIKSIDEWLAMEDSVSAKLFKSFYRNNSETMSLTDNATAEIVPSGTGFITEWVVSGTEAGRTVTLPLINTRTEGALSYNCTVSWGDGTPNSTVTAYNDADRIHTYAVGGTYQITVIGTCEGWSFNAGGDCLKLTRIINWGNISQFNGFKYLKAGFKGCTNLNSLGTGKILASGTGVLTQGFEEIFYGCTALTSITEGLFDNHINVTTYAFRSAFRGCTALTSIPTDLFRYNTLASDLAFYACFQSCTLLASIPTDLFRYNVAIYGACFQQTFYLCSSLPTVPANLFKYNTLVTGWWFCFYGCDKLQQNANIFYADGEQATRFAGKTIVFTGCFQRTAFTGTQGVAPDLWNCTFGSVTKTDCWDGAGNSLTSLSNYGSIPAAWL